MPNESNAYYKEAERNSATALTAALDDGKTHAVTGSVAVIKLPLIISSTLP
jgi:hypothetical protein